MNFSEISLVITGSEVLNGFILDTNTQFFATELYKRGYEVRESRLLRDDRKAILKTWEELYQRGDVIINAGGLGPTSDDLTVDLLCEWTGRESELYPPAEEKIRQFFQERKDRGLSLKYSLDLALRQARIVKGSIPLPNPVGLAPGIFLPEKRFFALPGYPIEIQGIWPQIWEHLESFPLRKSHTYELTVWGHGESALFSEIHPPSSIEMGVHALPLGCRLFFRSKEENLLNEFVEKLKKKYFGLTEENPLHSFVRWAISQGKTIALAESCTGGFLAKRFTDIPGVSTIFLGGVVSYANEIKESLLDVKKEILEKYGAVSAPCAKAMAEGALRKLKSDIALSLTGIAGPTGGSEEKPVGTLYIGLATQGEETLVGKFFYNFGRERFRIAACATAELVLYQKFVLGSLGKKLSDFLVGKEFMPVGEI